jgi:hypothetical protein
MYNLTVAQRDIEGPETIERTLLLDDKPIAVAFIDPEQIEGTLVWALAEETSLISIIDGFISDYLSKLNSESDSLKLEYWINDKYYTDLIDSNPSAEHIISRITLLTGFSTDLVELLDIASGNTRLEVVFDPGSNRPDQAVMLLSAIHIQALAEFFSRFHKSEEVRNDTTIALTAFHQKGSEWPEGSEFLSPLPVTEEEQNVEVDTSSWG